MGFFCDSCRTYNATARLKQKYTTSSSQIDYLTTGGRNNGPSIRMTGDSSTLGYSIKKTLSNQTAWLLQARMRYSSHLSANMPSFGVMSPNNVLQAGIGVNTSGNIIAYRGTSNLLATGTFTQSPGTDFHVEVEITIHASTGTIKVWINGAADPDIDFTGNTKGDSGSDYANQLVLANSRINFLHFSDIIAIENGSRIGEAAVALLTPAGAGTYTSFTPSSGTNHATQADLSDTTTVTASVDGYKDSYNFTNLASTITTVHGVLLHHVASKNDAGAMFLKPLCISGATEQAGDNGNLGTTLSYLLTEYATNPDTGNPWTPEELNAAEFGSVAATS